MKKGDTIVTRAFHTKSLTQPRKWYQSQATIYRSECFIFLEEIENGATYTDILTDRGRLRLYADKHNMSFYGIDVISA